MRGAGINQVTTRSKDWPSASRPLCLDVTRLVRRTGRRQTGVDRVEWAYLEWLLAQTSVPVFGLLRSALGYILLDRPGLLALQSHARPATWPSPSILSRLSYSLAPDRKAAESALRRMAIARSIPSRLEYMLRKTLPHGTLYFNLGHANLTPRVLRSVQKTPSVTSLVMIHDLIPLTHPEHQRDGVPEAFAGKLKNVCAYADFVLCNSEDTKRQFQRLSGDLSGSPELKVVHLGVDLAASPTKAPKVQSPYVVTVGTIEPRKNHSLLLDVWESWPVGKAPATLVICGTRGWKNETLFARLDAMKAAGYQIEEFNDLDDGEMLALVSQAEAAVIPSVAEGFGLPQLEAAQLGVPLICGDLDIYKELLDDLPIYASVSNAYAWKDAIEQTLQTDKEGRGRVERQVPALALPDWKTHFNLVLNNFG